MATTTQSTGPAGHRRGLLRFRPRINKDKLLLRQYGLTKFERVMMYLWGTGFTQVAIPIGSALYYLITQERYLVESPGGQPFTLFYLKDTWDRLPIHVANLFHAAWFHGSQIAPSWWVTARHDTRHVGIVITGIVLIGAFLIIVKPGKEPKPVTGKQMVLAVFLALIGALATTALMILLVTKGIHVLNNVGLVTGNPYLSELLGKGTLQLTLIGIPPGIVAKKILRRTFATLQLMSIENNLTRGVSKRRWRIYPPNYRRRFTLHQTKANGLRENRENVVHSRALTYVVMFGTPVLALLFGLGFWINYFGPASHH